MGLWNRHDQKLDRRDNILDDDECFYAREYTPGGRYDASECNNLIVNFKKPGDRRDTFEWRHRERAVQAFASELADWLPQRILVTFIPPAKLSSNPDYSWRFEDTFKALRGLRPDLELATMLQWREERRESHHGPRPSENELFDNLVLLQPERIYAARVTCLIDDVLTNGAHFKACQRKIQEFAPGHRVVGVFWARTKR